MWQLPTAKAGLQASCRAKAVVRDGLRQPEERRKGTTRAGVASPLHTREPASSVSSSDQNLWGYRDPSCAWKPHNLSLLPTIGQVLSRLHKYWPTVYFLCLELCSHLCLETSGRKAFLKAQQKHVFLRWASMTSWSQLGPPVFLPTENFLHSSYYNAEFYTCLKFYFLFPFVAFVLGGGFLPSHIKLQAPQNQYFISPLSPQQPVVFHRDKMQVTNVILNFQQSHFFKIRRKRNRWN